MHQSKITSVTTCELSRETELSLSMGPPCLSNVSVNGLFYFKGSFQTLYIIKTVGHKVWKDDRFPVAEFNLCQGKSDGIGTLYLTADIN